MSGQPLFRTGTRFAALRLAIGGAALASIVALAGCSGSADESTTTDAGQAPASSAPASSAPASSASASSAPASSAPADDNGKPSQDEVADGLAKWYSSDMGISGEAAKIAAKCLAGKLYTTMSTDALKSLADGKLDPSTLKPGDAQAFADASGACVKDIGGGS